MPWISSEQFFRKGRSHPYWRSLPSMFFAYMMQRQCYCWMDLHKWTCDHDLSKQNWNKSDFGSPVLYLVPSSSAVSLKRFIRAVPCSVDS